MTPRSDIANLPGYRDIQDLIPNGLFLNYSHIWRLSLERYRDDLDGTKTRLLLELASDINDQSADRVVVVMESPSKISFPDSWQILGLAFEDIRDRGLEAIRWQVYDYEMSGFSLYCSSIRLERRNNT